jgi:succinyl-CoA synthetase beta subunit
MVGDMCQGAELMAKYGVNVPPGIPIFKVDEAKAAAEKMRSPDDEVCSWVWE